MFNDESFIKLLNNDKIPLFFHNNGKYTIKCQQHKMHKIFDVRNMIHLYKDKDLSNINLKVTYDQTSTVVKTIMDTSTNVNELF